MFRSPLHFLVLVVALATLVLLVQFQVLTVAFEKLGLSEHSAYLLLMTTLAGSLVNLPLFTVDMEITPDPRLQPPAWLRVRPFGIPGKTIVAVNVGGAIVPIAFCLYLLMNRPVGAGPVLVCVTVVSAVAHVISRPIRGLGIGMPILIAPIAAAAIAAVIGAPETRAPLAYIGGTLGVLIGADLLRLKDIRRLGAPVASIGGAGSFDGIFVTGILAVLLA
ncbi:MAG TPA: DUF1614 domain-containing protein [Burkholderiales bacterium]|jgi:uncharacterized membrane protein|nr:DUF1614 domain-containing protein [Burkholderiales bacterium]